MTTTLAALLGPKLPPLRIVDIGAMDLGASPYQPLLELSGTTVIGFEPNPEECMKLNQQGNASQRHLPLKLRNSFCSC